MSTKVKPAKTPSSTKLYTVVIHGTIVEFGLEVRMLPRQPLSYVIRTMYRA